MERKGSRVSSDYEGHKSFDQRLDDFEEELEGLSDRFDRSVDRASERFEKKYYNTFGVLGPFLFSLLGLLFLAVAIWILGYMGDDLNSQILKDTADFLLNNIALFFGLMLLFNYSSYINKRYRIYFKWVYPAVNALNVLVVIWVLAKLFEIVNREINEALLGDVISSVLDNLPIIFLLALILSYLLFISRESRRTISGTKRSTEPRYYNSYKEDIGGDIGRTTTGKRLYRSGRDKLLGGVCGGIGEYVDIDPVVIRIIWVIGAFASFGTAILIYIILWIIIPRNPIHRWD